MLSNPKHGGGTLALGADGLNPSKELDSSDEPNSAPGSYLIVQTQSSANCLEVPRFGFSKSTSGFREKQLKLRGKVGSGQASEGAR